ncbi:uncharacterized protein V1513DRAFT_286397 [Lipomyces chichibuensis]|uniref:uncharacterized protein n=1 Tax=Lipomyces chichibuensis TaxID=1546026 RepID=UPI003344246F
MQIFFYGAKALANISLAATVVAVLFLTLQFRGKLPTIEGAAEYSTNSTHGHESISSKTSYECINPYAQPGFIWMETRNTIDNTTWVPFYSGLLDEQFSQIWDTKGKPVDKVVDNTRYFLNNLPPDDLLKNAPTQWFQLLRQYKNVSDAVATENRAGRKMESAEALRELKKQLYWVRNRSLLVVGDSADETLVSHFCNSLAGALDYDPRNSSETSIVTCNIREWNLTITHWQLGCVGLNCSSSAVETPESVDQKWDRYFVPTSDSVVGKNGVSPDLVIFQLGLWSEQFFVNQYMEYVHRKSMDYSRTLNFKELVLYTRLLRRTISKLRDLYGHKVPILYRTVALKNNLEQDIAALNLDSVARYACRELDIETIDFGWIVRGYYSFYRDDVNIDEGPLSALWANMAFWYLFRSQGGVEVRGDLVRMPDMDKTTVDAWNMCHDTFMKDLKIRS